MRPDARRNVTTTRAHLTSRLRRRERCDLLRLRRPRPTFFYLISSETRLAFHGVLRSASNQWHDHAADATTLRGAHEDDHTYTRTYTRTRTHLLRAQRPQLIWFNAFACHSRDSARWRNPLNATPRADATTLHGADGRDHAGQRNASRLRVLERRDVPYIARPSAGMCAPEDQARCIVHRNTIVHHVM